METHSGKLHIQAITLPKYGIIFTATATIEDSLSFILKLWDTIHLLFLHFTFLTLEKWGKS